MTVRGYFFPTLYALLLHVGIALAFVINWQSAPTPRLSITPVAVKAQLVQMKDTKPQPAAARKPEPKPAPKPEPKPAPKPEPKPQPKPPPVAKPVPKPAPPKPAPPKPAPPKVDRAAAREALARSSLDQALETEARALAAREGREAADEVEAFAAAISAMVEQNWSRPPSARNGMQAEIQINLVPTGEVVGVVVLQSSGDRLFDQSAERAVWRAARFDVPADPQKFERYFRRFRMVFRPEDLLR